MSTSKPYNDYSSYIREKFGERIQKISINLGLSCPNRDGTKAYGACTYCNIHTFSPDYCKPSKSVTQQLNEGISFFSLKYKTQKYFAYFQSYTNTYGEIEEIKKHYLEALSHPEVIGLVIGTRPDCISTHLLNFLEELSKKYYISLEFGVESTLNRTLELINRCHTFEDTINAFEMSKNRGIYLGAHIILGLPQESKDELLSHALQLSQLPIKTLKIHHLQIVKHSLMAHQFKEDPSFFKLFDVNEYLSFLTEFIQFLRPDIIIERFISESPPNLLIAPLWNGLKNFEFNERLLKKCKENDIYQGLKWK
ncbi:MAG: TIGR01212 family radical SAM protein [Flavobacteriia bacterium]|nr:TIGR01212 family radical SAM protein [Flavobacteriia bacterium]